MGYEFGKKRQMQIHEKITEHKMSQTKFRIVFLLSVLAFVRALV